MKKSIILGFLFLTISLSLFSQKRAKFSTGVKIIQKEKIQDYKKPESILFIFEGHTHLVNFYLNLEEKIRKIFKKKGRKKKEKIKLNFNYNLSAKKSLDHDLQMIPTKKYKKENFETICYIKQTDFKSWDNHLLESRKQNYNLNMNLFDNKSNNLLNLKLNVNSYYITTTQNKNSSKIIYQEIME